MSSAFNSSAVTYKSSFHFRRDEYTLSIQPPRVNDPTTPLLVHLKWEAPNHSSTASASDPNDVPSRMGDEWYASFSAADIEQMTSKTGEFQSFDDFTRMLVAILVAKRGNRLNNSNVMPYTHKNHQFNTLGIDILTYSDLEQLKQRRAGGTPAAPRETPRSAQRRKLNKRYMILSVANANNEDEKILYPLPLPFTPAPSGGSNIAHSAHNMAAHLSSDVNALKAQIAKLTNGVKTTPQASPNPTLNTSARKSSQKPLYHSASAIEIRSYRSSERSRSRSPHDIDADSRSRSNSPSERHHRNHSSSQHHHHHHRRGSSSSSSSSKRVGDHSRSRSRHRSRSRSRSHSPQPPRLSSHEEARVSDLMRQKDELAAIKHLQQSTRHTRSSSSMHHIKGDNSPRMETDNYIIDSPPEYPPSAQRAIKLLETKLAAAEEALSFEKQVSSSRIQNLESENRSLRKKEKELSGALLSAHQAVAALTAESEKLKAKVEEFVQTARGKATTQGRNRSRGNSPSVVSSSSSSKPRTGSPSLKQNIAPRPGSVSPSRARMLMNRSPGGPSSRSPSPYLQAQRDRRNARGIGDGAAGGSSPQSPSLSRGTSPAGSGRGTPTKGVSSLSPARGNAAVRRPSPAPIIPPRTGGGSAASSPARARSASPGVLRSASARTSNDDNQSPSARGARAPIDVDYKHWRTASPKRLGATDPFKRFSPTEYVAMKREQQLARAAEMAEQHRAEIARVTRPGPVATSVVPRGTRAASPSSNDRAYSNSYRGRRTPPPAGQFLDSPGRAGRTADQMRPSMYVDSTHDRARSLRFPLDSTANISHKSLNSNLSRTASSQSLEHYTPTFVPSATAPLLTSDYSSPYKRSSSRDLYLDSFEKSDEYDRDREHKEQHEEEDYSIPSHGITQPLVLPTPTDPFDEVEEVARSSRTYRSTHSSAFQDDEQGLMDSLESKPYTSTSATSPLSPSVDDEERKDGGQVDNVQALTARLAKLQEYLAAEKAKQ